MKKNKKHACMVAYSFYEMDNRVRRYAETLASEGWDVDAIAIGGEKQVKRERIKDVNVFRIQKRTINEKSKWVYLWRLFLFLIKSSFFLTRSHLRKKYDVIHVHSVPDFEVFASFFPKMLGAKIILDIHDIVPEFYMAKFNTEKSSMMFSCLVFIEKLSCSFADHVVISNHIWGERLMKRSVKKEKCTVILNYPVTSLFVRTKERQKKKEIRLIYPGTLNWHQGLDVAIKGVQILNGKIDNVRLDIFGKGPETDSLKTLVSELHLSDCVHFGGSVSIEEVVDKMQNADIGIVPKRNDGFGGEAFSTKILEFMSLGIPVLISATKIDQYYFNELIATFFKPSDEKSFAEQLLFLLQNPDIMEQRRVAALDFIKSNNWDVKKNIYWNIINNLTKK